MVAITMARSKPNHGTTLSIWYTPRWRNTLRHRRTRIRDRVHMSLQFIHLPAASSPTKHCVMIPPTDFLLRLSLSGCVLPLLPDPATPFVRQQMLPYAADTSRAVLLASLVVWTPRRYVNTLDKLHPIRFQPNSVLYCALCSIRSSPSGQLLTFTAPLSGIRRTAA